MLMHAVAQSFGNPLFLMEIFMNAKPQVVDSEKAKALQAALAQIEKQFGKGTIMRLFLLVHWVWTSPWVLAVCPVAA
ncbi:MAG: hypothetical protein RL420_1241 [Pseudomonadota bacterium]